MIDRQFFEQFPQPLPRDPNDPTRQWIDAHQDDMQRYDDALGAVAASHRISEAEGHALDEVGADFGPIGKRRGRGDDEYRAFLLSIANAFAGRGTPSGLRFAIGAGVQARPDEVEIAEHFEHLAYSVTLKDWIAHRTTTIDDLADLADPSGVELSNPGNGAEVTYQYEDLKTGVGFSEGYRDAIINAPDLGVGTGLDNATASIGRPGFGAGRFDGVDPFGDASTFGAQEDVEGEGIDLYPSGEEPGVDGSDSDTEGDGDDTETDGDTDAE